MPIFMVMVPSNHTNRVRFSKTNVMIIFDDHNHTRGIKHKLWYSREDVDKFKAETTYIVHSLRNELSRCFSTQSSAALIDYESLDESVGSFVGLENRLSGEYLVRRQLLISKVMEEHLWQRLRSRVGCSFDDDEAARIASISEENSEWARQRARENALSLQEDLYYEHTVSSHRHASQICTEIGAAKKRPSLSLESFFLSENNQLWKRDSLRFGRRRRSSM
jgi:hypothetical protein